MNKAPTIAQYQRYSNTFIDKMVVYKKNIYFDFNKTFTATKSNIYYMKNLRFATSQFGNPLVTLF